MECITIPCMRYNEVLLVMLNIMYVIHRDSDGLDIAQMPLVHVKSNGSARQGPHQT
jgi:hypothetical protein